MRSLFALVLAASLLAILPSAAAAQTDANLPENWQSLPFNDLVALAGRLQIAGNNADANMVVEFAGTKASRVGECRGLSGVAAMVLGQGSPAFLARTLLERCAADFGACLPSEGAWAVELLASQGKATEANNAFAAIVPRVTTVAGCRVLEKAAKAVLGGGSDGCLAGILVDRCQADFAKCGIPDGEWGLQFLVAQGKASQAKDALGAVAARITTVAQWDRLRVQAAALMPAEEASQWARTTLVARCLADVERIGLAKTKGVVELMAGKGGTPEGQSVLAALGKSVTALGGPSSLTAYGSAAGVIMGSDPNHQVAELLAARFLPELSRSAPGSQVYVWGTDLLISQGKVAEAKDVLAAGCQAVSGAAARDVVYKRAKAVMSADDAAKWFADQIVLRCERSAWSGRSAAETIPVIVTALADDGKTDHARRVMEAGGTCVPKVDDCLRLKTCAARLLRGGADAWLAGVLLQNCKADLEQCAPGTAAQAIEVLAAAGKVAEAKGILEKAGSRVATVAGCLALEKAANSLLADKADAWLAQVLVSRCKDDFGNCDGRQTVRAAGILRRAGKEQEAKVLLDSVKQKVSTVGQVRYVARGAPVPDRAIQSLLADLLLGQCQEDLEVCDVSDAGWAAWVLASAGRKADALGILASIEAGGRTPSGTPSEAWLDSVHVTHAYQSLHDANRARQWAMKAYEQTFGSEEVRQLADLDRLLAIAALLKSVGLTQAGKGYAGFAAGLVIASKNQRIGPGWEDCATTMETLAQPLLSDEVRQTILADLADSQGLVRQDLARILAWAHMHSGASPAWKAYLDQKASAPGLSADAKATWLLARGYAEGAKVGSLDVFAGRKWLDQALASDASASVRLLVLRTMVRGYEELLLAQKSLPLLDSVAGQFPADEAFESLRQRAVLGIHKQALEAQERRVWTVQRQTTAYVDELKSRLAVAQGRGDQTEVSRYQRLLAAAGVQ